MVVVGSVADKAAVVTEACRPVVVAVAAFYQATQS